MTSTLTNETIGEMTQEIWSALLADQGLLLPGDMGEGDLSATVSITGAWNGTACLACSEPAARRAASVMFDMTDDELSEEEIHDAIGELINVVGGNIKGILPGPTELSLPTVHQGPVLMPGHLDLGYKVTFNWMDEPVVVTVWTGD